MCGRPRVRPPLSLCGSRFARKVPSGKAFLATVLSKFAALAPENIPFLVQFTEHPHHVPPYGHTMMEGCQIRLEVIVPGFVLMYCTRVLWMVVRFVGVIRVPLCAPACPECVPCVSRLPPVSFYWC